MIFYEYYLSCEEFALDSKQKVEVAGRNGEPIIFEIVYEKKSMGNPST
jgi:hypothetical protein